MLRKLAAVALATSVVAIAAPAAAQETGGAGAGQRPMGLRFELDWNNPLGLANFGDDVGGSLGRISPSGDIKIGYDIDLAAGGFTPLISLGFINNSVDVTPDDSASVTAFVIGIEGRYYLQRHRAGLQPFVFAEFNHAFVSLSDDRIDDDDLLDDLASNLDYTQINAGLGMEYKFSGSSFAIGGRWGLGFAFQGFSEGDEDFGNTSIGTVGSIYAAWRL